jgi:hypothetical protein
MTNRELLEAAAKAAGIELLGTSWGMSSDGEFLGFAVAGRKTWNPLTDGGDALRLLTRLPYCEFYVSEIGVSVSWRRSDGSGHGFKCDEYAAEHGGDMNAAAQMAIVRAAVAMGKGDE